jgi:hypothetical protein
MLVKSKKNLKIFGKLFVFLGIYDIVWPIISYFLGKYNISDIATQANVSQDAVKIALIILVPSMINGNIDVYSTCDSLVSIIMISEMLKYNKELSK